MLGNLIIERNLKKNLFSSRFVFRYIEKLLPPDAKKLDSFTTNVSYEFKPTPGLIAKIFFEIETNKKQHGIDDWGLSQTR